jgi:hypothetical protein
MYAKKELIGESNKLKSYFLLNKVINNKFKLFRILRSILFFILLINLIFFKISLLELSKLLEFKDI